MGAIILGDLSLALSRSPAHAGDTADRTGSHFDTYTHMEEGPIEIGLYRRPLRCVRA